MSSWQGYEYLVGIDEVGRGPLAGPVTVCAVGMHVAHVRPLLRGIRDSKQLSLHAREEWFMTLKEARADGKIMFATSFVQPKTIDAYGIVRAINLAIQRSLEKITMNPQQTLVLLDGGLKAPERFIHQQTIIRGDAKEPIIAAASVVAKVARDRRMVRYGKEHPAYGFERHKGYGTSEHRRMIQQWGLTPLHRTTFCEGVLPG